MSPPVFADSDPAHAQAGFRVPGYIVSPHAPRGAVNHTVFDHSSILKLVEWRWGLAPLTPRDRGAANLAEVLDFGHYNPTTSIDNQPDPGPHLCQGDNALGPGMLNSEPFWQELAASRLVRGWSAVG